MKPKALKNGSTVGIVSPARHSPEDWLLKGKAELEAAGFKVAIHPQNHLQDYQLAGTDKERAAAIMDYFKDDSIDAIVCARGGIGSYRVVPHLDYDIIRANPKIFCGFSDITTLLTTLHQRSGITTFHGPLLLSFFKNNDPDNITHFVNFFSGRDTQSPIFYPSAEVFHEGVAQGKLIGGNMTLLQNLIGSKDDFDTNGAILLIEDDDGEKQSDIDRVMWHLKIAGKFDNIKGLIVGEFTGFREDSAGHWKHSVRDLLREHIPPNIPVATHFPCGHGKTIVPLPIGVQTQLDTRNSRVVLTFKENVFA